MSTLGFQSALFRYDLHTQLGFNGTAYTDSRRGSEKKQEACNGRQLPDELHLQTDKSGSSVIVSMPTDRDMSLDDIEPIVVNESIGDTYEIYKATGRAVRESEKPDDRFR